MSFLIHEPLSANVFLCNCKQNVEGGHDCSGYEKDNPK